MNSKNPKSPISWSELPSELLLPIAERLATQSDVLSFRGVCKIWRASAPLSLLASKNILSPIFPHHLKNDSYYVPKHQSLCMNCVILLRSNVNPELPPFIMIVDECSSGKLHVKGLFCTQNYELLFSFGNSNLTSSRFRASELARFPTFLRDGEHLSSAYHYEDSLPSNHKVILFVDPNCENRATINDYSFVTLVKKSESRELVVTKIDGESHKLTYPSKKKGRRLIDLVNFKGKVYVIDNYHKLLSIDYHTLEMSKIVKSLRSEIMCDRKFMFVSCDELYVVSMWMNKSYMSLKEDSVEFSVFKLNEKKKKWNKLKGIGDDKILFLTFDGSFIASAKEFPGCKGNCIIFLNLIRRNRYNFYPRYEIYVYHFDGGDSGRIGSYPGYSDVVMWPPPSWLCNEFSSR